MVGVVVRRDDGDVGAVRAEVVDEHKGSAADAIDGAEGLGAEENAFAAEEGGELGEVVGGGEG